ncbi:serine carboxypeptidase-like 45 isoform X2 [Ziziphus jujuba]|uniref:Carboxypeptidase n=1 Tax=Ziziphus jujuba TaxID=326968 RepID=A0A6P4AZH4_ZIZJJ|nr:serine carboxypeptidase-like 45 isoform X2 [Ziziphus jujuba]
MMPFPSEPWIKMAVMVFVIFIQTNLVVESQPKSDKITSLPGQPDHVSFQQFSGYVMVDEKQHRALFYYFVEAEEHPASRPLVLWLAGGPGCSSVGAGAFMEHGPFRPNGENLVKNEYSWNKEANMLYPESPAGVGFSYSSNKSFYSYINDDITAQDSLTFLKQWLIKYPEYNNRDFFIAGESYAGHYVPQLAQLVLHSNLRLSLRGVAIGNPLLEFNTDINSWAGYYWSHGIISDSSYKLVKRMCNTSRLRREYLLGGPVSESCRRVNHALSKEMTEYLALYDVSGDKCLSNSSNQLHLHPLNPRKCNDIDVCLEEKTEYYFNRKDVQNSLHARLVGVTQWSLCINNSKGSVINYDKQNEEIPTIHLLGSLVKSGIRVMVYSGDQDSVIPFTGTRSLVSRLAKELKLKTTQPYRAWIEGRQVGGWSQVYGNDNMLSFAIIRGGSHAAPSTQPERSLLLFHKFLQGKPLPLSNA